MATVNIGRVRPAYKKEWNATDTYAALDFVLYTNGTLYIALKDVPANYEPDSQTEYWAPFGSKGLTGNGIASFVFVEDQDAGKLWKMAFTDGTETDILVPRGSIGPKGNGIVSISFDKALDNGDYQYSIVMDDGQTFSIVAPQGPSFRIVQTPKVEIVGGTSVSKADFVVKITDFASLYNHVFAERVIDIARDDKFSQLVVTATITPDDEDKNTYTVSQLLLDYGTKYFVRARDKNSAGDFSDYSVPVFAVTKMEVREIEKPVISAPSSGGQLATLIPEFTFSAPVWIASTGNIDKMQVIIRLDSATLFDSGWVDLQTDYTVADFRYDWGTSYSATVQYKESATGLVSPVSNAVGYATRAAYVVAPVITFPAANSKVEAKTIAIQTSAFATVGTEDAHQSTTWMVAGDAEFKNILWELKNSTSNLTSATAAFTTPLPAGQTVYIGAIHNGATLGSSMKSTPLPVVVGTTKKAVVTKPTAGASVYPSTGVAIETGPFSVEIGSDTHKDSSYKICRDAEGTDIVVSAMHVADKTLHVFDKPELVEGTHYFAFAQHTGVTYGDGPWSDGVECVASSAPFVYNVVEFSDIAQGTGRYTCHYCTSIFDEIDNCYYTAFYVESYVSDNVDGNYLCLAKVDLTGNMVWCKNIYRTPANYDSNIYLMKNSTNFIIVTIDYISKISFDGVLMLRLKHYPTNGNARGFSACMLSDGTFVKFFVATSDSTKKVTLHVVCFNTDLSIKWYKTSNNESSYGYYGDTFPCEIYTNGEFIYLIFSNYVSTTGSRARGYLIVRKYDYSMNQIWAKQCSIVYTAGTVMERVEQKHISASFDKFGNMYLAFVQKGEVGTSSSYSVYPLGMVILDNAGYVLKSRVIAGTSGAMYSSALSDKDFTIVCFKGTYNNYIPGYHWYIYDVGLNLDKLTKNPVPLVINAPKAANVLCGTVDVRESGLIKLIGVAPDYRIISDYNNNPVHPNGFGCVTVVKELLQSVIFYEPTWDMPLTDNERRLQIYGESNGVNLAFTTGSVIAPAYTATDGAFTNAVLNLESYPDATGKNITCINTLFVGSPL